MIVCKSAAELGIMREAGQILASVLAAVREKIASGVTLLDLETVAESEIAKAGAKPAFKGYRGYPNVLCTSVNEEVIHGIPSGRVLRDGDLVSVDCGVIWKKFYADSAFTVSVGAARPELEKLLQVTRESLEVAIDRMRAGNRLGDVSAAVQQHVEAAGFNVVREFCGHGIGTSMHEDPQVPNYGTAGEGPRLKAGMVLAIEPMVVAGSPAIKVLEDQWTAVTVDKSPAAHFEHTVAVTDNGPWILTGPA